jgi:solute carrier family 25 carnitine/acylcarnitine transporter 20/29
MKGSMAGGGSSAEEAAIGLASGIVFGIVSPIVGHPFDCVKTRMQADVAYQSSGFLYTVKHIYATEGMLRGFYRGFVPPLLGSMAFRGIQFSAYGGAYAWAEQYQIFKEPIPYTGGLRLSVLVGVLSAATARAVIESPLDFMKVRYMVDKGALQDAAGHVAKESTRQSLREFAGHPLTNVRHLYKGFVPTWFRTMGLLGSFFVMVDYSVRYIPDVINAPGFGPFFKGGVCATAAWFFAFPFESAKSVIQADTAGKYRNLSTAQVMAELYRERGLIHGLYRGFGPGAGRSFVANGISMTVFSWVQDLIR